MKALILAAGYATRLKPLTDAVPKQLLPVGGRPMVDWILDKIREAGIADVHLVTNGRFAGDLTRWGEAAGVHVHDDGTTTNETRLGAIGDIRFVQEHTDFDDDLQRLIDRPSSSPEGAHHRNFQAAPPRLSPESAGKCGSQER